MGYVYYEAYWDHRYNAGIEYIYGKVELEKPSLFNG